MSIGHVMPASNVVGLRIPDPRTLVSEFEEALLDYYGPHLATPIAMNCAISLKAVQMGPLSAGIAAGEGIAWERHGGQLDRRWHDCVFLVQQQRGNSVVTLGGRRIALETSDFLLVSPFGDCRFEMVQRSALLAVPLPKTDLEPLDPRLDQMIGCAIDGARGFGRILSATLDSLHLSQQTFDNDERAMLLKAILSMLHRSWTSGNAVDRAHSHRKIALLQHWVEKNVSEPDISPDRLAKEYGVSRRQLYRMFAREDTTPQAWVSDIRLRVAHTFLSRHADSHISEIAERVGFQDPTTFSRAFRNRYGMLPSLVRSSA